MKLKEIFYLIGIKPAPCRYGWLVETHHLERDGEIQVAQWQHEAAYRVAAREVEVDRFRQFLRPGDVAIDIGAHTGDSALPMTQRRYLQVEFFNLRRSEPGYREALFRFLTGHNSEVYRISRESLMAERVGAANLMRWRGCDVWCVPTTGKQALH